MKAEAHNIEFTQKWRGGSSLVRGGVAICDWGAHRLALPRQAQDKMLLHHMQKKGVA